MLYYHTHIIFLHDFNIFFANPFAFVLGCVNTLALGFPVLTGDKKCNIMNKKDNWSTFMCSNAKKWNMFGGWNEMWFHGNIDACALIYFHWYDIIHTTHNIFFFYRAGIRFFQGNLNGAWHVNKRNLLYAYETTSICRSILTFHMQIYLGVSPMFQIREKQEKHTIGLEHGLIVSFR